MPHLKLPYDHRLNKPTTVEILEKVQEREDVATFTFQYDPIGEPIDFRPGQFVMIWVPGSDEIPMSISHIYEENKISISVAAVGKTTKALNSLKVGDSIGARGPYGTSFQLKTGNDQVAIIIGGGIGVAAVLPLVYEAYKMLKSETPQLREVVFLEGVKNHKELLYHREITQICEENNFIGENSAQFCTDDGSFGFEGFPTQKLEEYLSEKIGKTLKAESITVYACGPEIMLHKVFEICERFGVEVQLSLERMMRCGFGICGLCALEPTGLLVCKDGPIFTNKQLRDCKDFGTSHRDFAGREIPL